MPVFTFSTRDKKPLDTEAVERLKEHCEKHGINFSAVIVHLVKENLEEIVNESKQPRRV